MNKQRINLTIDPDIVLWFKQQKMNMSETANSMFRTLIDTDLNINQDERDILDRIEETRSELNKRNNELERLTAQLQIVRSQNEKEFEMNKQKTYAKARAIKLNNPLRGLIK